MDQRTALAPVQHRHEAMAGIERDRIQPRPARGSLGQHLAGKGQKRALHRVALHAPDPGLAMQFRVVAQRRGTGEIAQPPARRRDRAIGGIALAAHGIAPAGHHDRRHRHLVPGQRAGLVGADHRHRANRLDRRQPPHDGMAPRHRLHADGQRDGHHRRQPLGDRRHRHADHDHEQVGKVAVLHEGAEGQQQARDQQDQQAQPAREMVHLPDQRRGQGFHPRQQPANAADFRGSPGRGDDPAPGALGHQRA